MLTSNLTLDNFRIFGTQAAKTHLEMRFKRRLTISLLPQQLSKTTIVEESTTARAGPSK
jgi:hypothetical protein